MKFSQVVLSLEGPTINFASSLSSTTLTSSFILCRPFMFVGKLSAPTDVATMFLWHQLRPSPSIYGSFSPLIGL